MKQLGLVRIVLFLTGVLTPPLRAQDSSAYVPTKDGTWLALDVYLSPITLALRNP